MQIKRQIPKSETNVIDLFSFRYLPYWPLFMCMFLLAFAGAWAWIQFTQPMYKATATIMIKDEKKGVDDSELLDALNIYSSSKIVENEIEVLQSRAIMNEVVIQLHLYAPVSEVGEINSVSAYNSSPVVIEAKNPYQIQKTEDIKFKISGEQYVLIGNQKYPMNEWVKTPYGEIIFKPNSNKTMQPTRTLAFRLFEVKEVAGEYLEQLQVKAASKLSTVINLSILDEVPQKGEDILNQILDIYNKFSIREKNRLAANTLSFVEERLNIVEIELDSIERAIQYYKSDKKVTNLSEQGRMYLQSVGENDRKAGEIDIQMAVLEEIEKYITASNGQSGIIPSTLGVKDPVLEQMLSKLRDAELRYEALSRTTAENNPMVIALVAEIQNIRPGILMNIRNQKNALRTSRSEVSQTNEAYGLRLQSLPEKERELLDISRQQIIINDVYSFLLHKREETALSYASMVADSWIVNRALTGSLPVSPNQLIVYLIALIIGFIMAAILVTMKEVMNKKVLFRSEIEESTKTRVSAEILHVKGKREFVVNHENTAIINEQFRQLRATIGMYGKNATVKKLLVTSSIAGEGKSFISSNLALSLSLSGKKVLLIDLDLRNPVISSMTGVAGKPGVTEFLEGSIAPSEIIHNYKHKNMFVVGAGEQAVNTTELLFNGKLAELFEYFEQGFDYIVIDTAPIALTIDAYILSEFSDTTLFVIRHRFTPKKMIQSLDENARIQALKNVSIVFNGIRSRGILKGKYGYGYGYGYEYVYKPAYKKVKSDSLSILPG